MLETGNLISDALALRQNSAGAISYKIRHVLFQTGKCLQQCAFCSLGGDGNPTDPDRFLRNFKLALSKGFIPEVLFKTSGDVRSDIGAVLSMTMSEIKDCLVGMNFVSSDLAVFDEIKRAGVDYFRSNLEATEAKYRDVSGKSSDHRLIKRQCLEAARNAGLGVRTGWIVGLGETDQDINQLTAEVENIGAGEVTLNFFNPLLAPPGCPHDPILTQTALRRLAMTRLNLPDCLITLGGAVNRWFVGEYEGKDALGISRELADGVFEESSFLAKR